MWYLVDMKSDELVQETEINELLEDLEGKTVCNDKPEQPTCEEDDLQGNNMECESEPVHTKVPN